MMEETRELSRQGRRGVFYSNIKLMHEGSILLTKSSPKGPHLLRTSHRALKFQHIKFGGGGHKLSDHGKSRAPIIHMLNHLAVFHLFFMLFSFHLSCYLSYPHNNTYQWVLSRKTASIIGNHFSMLGLLLYSLKMGKWKYFPLCFTNELQKLPQKKN